MKRILTGAPGRVAAAALGLWVLAAQSAAPTAESLAPEPRHEKIGQLVTEFVQKSHYSRSAVNDELSGLDTCLADVTGTLEPESGSNRSALP